MMGAGGFIRNPSWEIGGDDVTDEEFDNVLVFTGVDLWPSEDVLFLPATDEELDDDDSFGDGEEDVDEVEEVNSEDLDDEYLPSDSIDDEEFDDDVDDNDDDNDEDMSNDDESVPETTTT